MYPQTASTRTVVLLQQSERDLLEKLAAEEHVSSGEILRRSLHAYERPASASEQEALATLLLEMNTALDATLSSIRSARSTIHENLEKIESLKQVQQ